MSESFNWTSKSGIEITLPAMSTLSAGVFRRHRTKNEVDFVFSVLEEVSDTAALAKIDEVPLPELNDMFEAWQKGSGATVGESSGSST